MATAHIHHPASGHDDDTPGVNRREFLYYLLGGSAALIAAGSCGAVAWFMMPQTRIPFGRICLGSGKASSGCGKVWKTKSSNSSSRSSWVALL